MLDPILIHRKPQSRLRIDGQLINVNVGSKRQVIAALPRMICDHFSGWCASHPDELGAVRFRARTRSNRKGELGHEFDQRQRCHDTCHAQQNAARPSPTSRCRPRRRLEVMNPTAANLPSVRNVTFGEFSASPETPPGTQRSTASLRTTTVIASIKTLIRWVRQRDGVSSAAYKFLACSRPFIHTANQLISAPCGYGSYGDPGSPNRLPHAISIGALSEKRMTDGITEAALAHERRTQEIFGPIKPDLDHWLEAALWTVDEAVAISLSRDPRFLSKRNLEELWPDELQKVQRQMTALEAASCNPTVGLFVNRFALLERAVMAGDIRSERIDGVYRFRPRDFLLWVKEQHETSSCWQTIFPALQHMLNTRTTGAADGHSAHNANATKEEATPPFSKPGADPEANCLNWLEGKMSEPRPDPLLRTQEHFEVEAKKRFGVGTNAFNRTWHKAKIRTNCSWIKRGRPANHTANLS